MIKLHVQQESGPQEFLFLEAQDGRRLLYQGQQLVAHQPPPVQQGEAVEAQDWQYTQDSIPSLGDILYSLHDEPQLPVLPPDQPSPGLTVYAISSVQLVDEGAWFEENQLAGMLESTSSFLVTAHTDQGLCAFLISREGEAWECYFDSRQRVQRGAPVILSNGQYLRSAIRRWLRDSLGDDWSHFQ